MDNIINIITRCTRPDNLLEIRKSIYKNINNPLLTYNWIICFDSRILKDIDVELLAELQSSNIKIDFKFLQGDYWGLSQLNSILVNLLGWVYHLDDDNILHEHFSKEIIKLLIQPAIRKEELNVIIFSQKVSYKDFSNLDIRIAHPENVKVSKIDLAQWLIHSDVHKQGYLYGSGYIADGEFIEKLYNEKPNYFEFIDNVLCYYNFLEKHRTANVPKVLYIGKGNPEIKTTIFQDWETSELNIKYIENDENILDIIQDFEPDAILTYGGNWEKNKNLSKLSPFFRKKWVHIKSNSINNLGDISYHCAMDNILKQASNKEEDLISFITPVYNTGEKIIKTYESLLEQTYNNWEWVLVNDSTDGGKTLKIIERLAKKDPRVVIYDFRKKSGGNIGEAKYRGFMMARGYLLAELDHDDWLVPDCAEYLYKASKKHKNCGFFYNDTAEVNEEFEALKYPDGFAFGYGKYEEVLYKETKILKIAQQNINPKTIRHIVGIPNHIRAWRRDIYMKIGGHARGLAIADDYELIVRTFLETEFCKIPKLGYIQFIYNNNTGRNTHDLARSDIQRRVRTISEFYNIQIKERFEELNLKDWAYEYDSNNPLDAPSLFGEEEQVANIIYIE